MLSLSYSFLRPLASPSARREWIEIVFDAVDELTKALVSLREEGVD